MSESVESVLPIEYIQFLVAECGYRNVRILPGGQWAATHQFMFTCAILVGKVGDRSGYEDRWCYHDADSAAAALEAWSGIGEPDGWHRHPRSGRRRNGEEEYVNF